MIIFYSTHLLNTCENLECWLGQGATVMLIYFHRLHCLIERSSKPCILYKKLIITAYLIEIQTEIISFDTGIFGGESEKKRQTLNTFFELGLSRWNWRKQNAWQAGQHTLPTGFLCTWNAFYAFYNPTSENVAVHFMTSSMCMHNIEHGMGNDVP